MLEQELFLPVAAYLEGLGYQVQAEVKYCDIAAIRGDEVLLVELKTGFTLKLVYQAIDRQRISPNVVVAIPRPKRQKGSPWTDILRLCKRLDVGLLTVAMDSPLKTVETHGWPSGSQGGQLTKKRQALAEEILGRSSSQNVGGSNRKKLMTAYREKMIALACYIEKRQVATAKELREAFDQSAVSMVSRNLYGWFVRVEKGVYGLSEKGRQELSSPAFCQVVAYYKRQNMEGTVHGEQR